MEMHNWEKYRERVIPNSNQYIYNTTAQLGLKKSGKGEQKHSKSQRVKISAAKYCLLVMIWKLHP